MIHPFSPGCSTLRPQRERVKTQTEELFCIGAGWFDPVTPACLMRTLVSVDDGESCCGGPRRLNRRPQLRLECPSTAFQVTECFQKRDPGSRVPGDEKATHQSLLFGFVACRFLSNLQKKH